MALITCPECGREISDKAVACPGCGYPMPEKLNETAMEEEIAEKSEFDIIADEICNEYLPEDYKKKNHEAIRRLRERTGADLKSAADAVDIRFTGSTFDQKCAARKQERKKEREEIKKRWKELDEQQHRSMETLSSLFRGSKVAKCPRCHSTSISYDTKKLSLGRAAVGGALAGPAGAVLGGVTSKKGYAVCLKCGKRWKI